MKIKWQWFLGGRVMFWIATIMLIIFITIYILTYIIDPMTLLYISPQHTDSNSIKAVSEQYMKQLGVSMSKPVVYRFVEYKHENYFNKHNMTLLGTFHEWNNKYYIDISMNLFGMGQLYNTVIHETRHMIVQELKNKKLIDLDSYTEPIAQEKNDIYNKLFEYSIKLLKEEQNNGE